MVTAPWEGGGRELFRGFPGDGFSLVTVPWQQALVSPVTRVSPGLSALQGEMGLPGQKGSKGDKGEPVSMGA